MVPDSGKWISNVMANKWRCLKKGRENLKYFFDCINNSCRFVRGRKVFPSALNVACAAVPDVVSELSSSSLRCVKSHPPVDLGLSRRLRYL